MTLHALRRLRELTFRSTALREARAAILDSNSKDARGRAANQARLLVEVARRTAEPTDALPAGSRPSVLLQLYREGIYWALAALGSNPRPPLGDLKAMWAEFHPETALPGWDADSIELVRGALTGSRHGSLEAGEDQAKRVRAFAEALVSILDAPRRRARRLQLQRLSMMVLLASLAVLAGIGVRALVRPNLLANRPFRTSSTWAGCPADPSCAVLMFCTNPETNPWIEFDLGQPKRLHQIEAVNRPDCCGERAVPLVVESSMDRSAWTEVARRDAEFTRWTAPLKPEIARYVRLRVPRSTVFHLQELVIR